MKSEGKIIRIALIGPESTAKSTLAQQLAAHYQTVWVQEYAREYLSALTYRYTGDDILAIAKEQLKREKEILTSANRLLFSDTELILAKVWHEDLFGSFPPWFTKNIRKNKYDLYLLTSADLPWKQDPLRENPYRRELLFDWYERELRAIRANYAIIRGKGKTRFENCVSAVEKILSG